MSGLATGVLLAVLVMQSVTGLALLAAAFASWRWFMAHPVLSASRVRGVEFRVAGSALTAAQPELARDSTRVATRPDVHRE